MQFKEDLTKEDRDSRQKLWPLIKKARDEGKSAYFVGGRGFIEGWSDMILKFKASVIDKCKFVIEFNSDECVELAGRYTEPVIIQKCKEQNEKYSIVWVKCVHTFGLKPSSHLLSNDKNHSIRINQLFSPDCDGNTPKTVLLSGDSGR
uniref:Uncharacterized protein n=1 Tax=Cyprinus carpio carpio TaxID=630221 RepID=A0A9J7ZLN7_CYPCA